MRAVPIAAAVTAASWLALHHAGRTSGSTTSERRRRLPGDYLVHRPQASATHAATLPAPPDEVWPWLVQVGWHRGGWYTPRWVDVLLFPDNAPSADDVWPELQQLDVGDFVPDGPPETECGFHVVDVVPGHHLVLRSDSHLPLSWRRRGLAAIDWTWSFYLAPDPGGTRLVFRWRARTSPWWLTLGCHLFVLPADAVMARGMLRGLRRRIGATAARHEAEPAHLQT
jgi:hypothetical protein